MFPTSLLQPTTEHPFHEPKLDKPRPSVFRLYLRNTSRQVGSSGAQPRFTVNFPADLDPTKNYMMAVEFVYVAGNAINNWWEVRIPSLVRTTGVANDGYGIHTVAAVVTGNGMTRDLTRESLGTPIVDRSFFRNSALALEFVLPDGSLVTEMNTAPWCVGLAVWEVE